MGEVHIQPQYPVQVLSKKLINPAIPTPHNLHNLKITSLDQLCPSLYLPFILYYPASTDKDQRAKNEERSKQLEKSLSEVLTLFYPLAGRFIEDKLLIDCNDQGIEYIENQVSGQLAPLLGRDVDSKQLGHLIPFQFESPTSALVAVQCNMFECGGLAIGLCISHRILDGFSLTKFIDGWATACRGEIHKVDTPSFDLAIILRTREQFKPLPAFFPVLNTASKTFVFSSLAISKLRAIAKEHQSSRVQLVTAVIWKALIGVAEAKHGQLRPSIVTHTMNMRGRTVLPISDDFCGNLFRPATIKFTPNEKSKAEFHDLVSLLLNGMRNAVTECAKPQNGDDLFSMVSNAWREASEELNNGKADAYAFTSLCRMPIYADFGWGKPARVTHVQSVVELVMLLDTRDGEGIEAWVSLDENDMNVFEQ